MPELRPAGRRVVRAGALGIIAGGDGVADDAFVVLEALCARIAAAAQESTRSCRSPMSRQERQASSSPQGAPTNDALSHLAGLQGLLQPALRPRVQGQH
jgi:hypothetical protein